MIASTWKFLNSSFFIALVTLTAGLIAYLIYRKGKNDFKRDAANILLLEIQNAERLIIAIKEKLQKDNQLSNDVYLMATASWQKYQYLFVRDFDRDEWDTIAVFYDKCKLIDEAAAQNNSYFQKNEEQARTNLLRISADYIKQSIETNEESKGEFLEKSRKFQKEYLSYPELMYSPQKPLNDAKLHLETIPKNLSLTSIGAKLKRIANF